MSQIDDAAMSNQALKHDSLEPRDDETGLKTISIVVDTILATDATVLKKTLTSGSECGWTSVEGIRLS